MGVEQLAATVLEETTLTVQDCSWCGLGLEHSGLMLFLPSVADLGGCSLSGLRALRSKGEPGSADLGRLRDFFVLPSC